MWGGGAVVFKRLKTTRRSSRQDLLRTRPGVKSSIGRTRASAIELELGLIQSHMAQKPVLRYRTGKAQKKAFDEIKGLRAKGFERRAGTPPL